jgi:hypothetical protein
MLFTRASSIGATHNARLRLGARAPRLDLQLCDLPLAARVQRRILDCRLRACTLLFTRALLRARLLPLLPPLMARQRSPRGASEARQKSWTRARSPWSS